MGLSLDEHRIAIELAIAELADVAGIPPDQSRYPGVSAMRAMVASRKAAYEWESSEHLRIQEQQRTEARLAQEAFDWQQARDRQARQDALARWAADHPHQNPPVVVSGRVR